MARRLLPLAALAAAVFIPAAVAAPPATHTVRGTVVAKDRAHHALVLALSDGSVQAVVVPGSLARVAPGRKVIVRATTVAGHLATASRITLNGTAHRALVRGTIVRVVNRRAVLNAGGTMLAVTLAPTKSARTTASARSGPKVGDVVKAEVEIDDDGSLDADHVAVVESAAGTGAGDEHATTDDDDESHTSAEDDDHDGEHADDGDDDEHGDDEHGDDDHGSDD